MSRNSIFEERRHSPNPLPDPRKTPPTPSPVPEFDEAARIPELAPKQPEPKKSRRSEP